MKADRWDEFTLEELEALRPIRSSGYDSERLADDLAAEIDKAIEQRRSGAREPQTYGDIERVKPGWKPGDPAPKEDDRG